ISGLSSACDLIVGDLSLAVRRQEPDENPPTRSFDRHPVGTSGILVLCHLFGESRVQSRVPAVAQGYRPDLPAVHRLGSSLERGRANGWGAWPKALPAIEYPHPNAEAAGNTWLYQAKPGFCR